MSNEHAAVRGRLACSQGRFPRTSMAAPGARLRRGVTLIEIVIAMPIIVVALSLLIGTIASASRQREIVADNSRAAEAIRALLERMRNEDFGEIVSLYDPDPLNDPNGPGTAPGSRIAIEGLTPRTDSPDGRCAEIFLPLVDTAPVGSVLPIWQLREDVVNEALGMPRDLSADNSIDSEDHSLDYDILPVLIEAQWQGAFGPRTLRFFTLLTEYRH